MKQVDKRNGDSAQHIEKEKVAPFLQTRIVQVCKEWPKVKKNPKTVQAGLIADLGGIEHLSTAQQILIELLGRDLYLLDETDHWDEQWRLGLAAKPAGWNRTLQTGLAQTASDPNENDVSTVCTLSKFIARSFIGLNHGPSTCVTDDFSDFLAE